MLNEPISALSGEATTEAPPAAASAAVGLSA
jgi:hypothetical protein